jgi:hypothetical protein
VNEVSPEAWLSQEVEDLLDQGPVGLYEFVWGLRGSSYDLSDDEAIRLSADIARRTVRAGRAEIYLVTWPKMEIVQGPLSLAVLEDPNSWSEGKSGSPLMALVPRSAAGELHEA